MTQSHQGDGAVTPDARQDTRAGVEQTGGDARGGAPRVGPLDRTQIVDATEACLKSDGYDGTTIRRIAKRLGCAVGSIYRHFTDKRALLDAVAQRRFEPVAEAVEAGESVSDTVRRYVELAVAEPEQYRLMFWLAMLNRDASGVPAVVTRILDGWAGQLEGGLDEARRVWALNHGQVMLGRAVQDDDPTRVVVLVDAIGQPKRPPHNPSTSAGDDLTLL